MATQSISLSQDMANQKVSLGVCCYNHFIVKPAMETFKAATVIMYPRWGGVRAEGNSWLPVPSVRQTEAAGPTHPPPRLAISKNEATEPELGDQRTKNSGEEEAGRGRGSEKQLGLGCQ